MYFQTYGLFDPRSLGIQFAWNIPKSLQKYFEGSIKQHLKEAQADFRDLDESEKDDLLFLTTAATHETKHFHDIVGTTFGFTYYHRSGSVPKPSVEK